MTSISRAVSSDRHGRAWFTFGLAGLATALAACGDSGETTSSTGTSSSIATSSSSSTGTGGGGGAPIQPAIAFVDLAGAMDLTPDGSVALIEDLASPTVDAYFYETSSGALTKKAEAGDPLADMVTAISGTHRITAIHGVPTQAGMFTEPAGWVDLASPFPMGCDVNQGGAWDVSADGTIVVGMMWNGCAPQAFRWVDDGGAGKFALLDVLGASFAGSSLPPVNRATVVSDDGTIAAGFAQKDNIDRFPAIWKADGTGFTLDDLPPDTPGEVLSISADGTTVAGTFGFDAFRWTAASGSVLLPRLDSALPTDFMFPNAIAQNGKLVFGASGDAFSGVPVAFVWTEAAGIRPLQDIVVANGLSVPTGFGLSNVLGASTDGSILLGTALNPDTQETKSFVLQLPASAYDM